MSYGGCVGGSLPHKKEQIKHERLIQPKTNSNLVRNILQVHRRAENGIERFIMQN